MEGNSSLICTFLNQLLTVKVMIVHILVIIFLCINMLLIVTFVKKECFYTSARYILFFVTLLSDSFLLVTTDILLILTRCSMQVWLCIIITLFVLVYSIVTPVTLTAMTLERFVAICMPLRHGQLCSTRSTKYCVLIIHGVSSGPCIVITAMFLSTASLSFYKQYTICSVEMFMLYRWQDHVRSAISQFYFLTMGITIVFSYVQIMKVAKAASGENKKSTQKGLRTVILHAFQLLLCLIQLWTPFVESAVLQIDVNLFRDFRYFNYVLFSIVPRCLSPLIYGLRDEKFFLELKNLKPTSSYFNLGRILRRTRPSRSIWAGSSEGREGRKCCHFIDSKIFRSTYWNSNWLGKLSEP